MADLPPIEIVVAPMSALSATDEGRIEDALACVSPAGFVREDAETGEVDDRASTGLRWLVYLDSARDPALHREEIVAALPRGLALAVDARRLSDRSYETRWQDYFRGHPAGAELWIHPPWEEPPEAIASERRAIVIHPGMAFGTGTHETTLLCLEEVERFATSAGPSWSMLDVGCGSGILAIAALSLGCGRAVGVEIDPDARREADENARANGVGEAFEIAASTEAVMRERFDLVVANILPHVLRSLGRYLVRRVAPGGTLALSGVLRDDADALAEELAALITADSYSVREAPPWSALVWRGVEEGV